MGACCSCFAQRPDGEIDERSGLLQYRDGLPVTQPPAANGGDLAHRADSEAMKRKLAEIVNRATANMIDVFAVDSRSRSSSAVSESLRPDKLRERRAAYDKYLAMVKYKTAEQVGREGGAPALAAAAPAVFTIDQHGPDCSLVNEF